MNRRMMAGLIFTLLLSFGLLSVALAHAKLVSSEPSAGARLTRLPTKVTLVFSEEIDDQESSFTVTDAKGATVGAGKLDSNDLDHKTLSGTLNAGAGDGVYTVDWKALTPDDNGRSEGRFTFGVNADPGPQSTAEPEHDEEMTPTTTTAGGAVRPTAAAGNVVQPTTAPAGGANPANLPRTGDSQSNVVGYALLGAVIALAGGMGLRRASVRARR